MPRVIVFRLNGGGDCTWLGGVDFPAVVVVVVVGCCVIGFVTPPVVVVDAVGVVTALGDTSGEKMPPSAYSDRLSPYDFTRARFTSMISTSTTISERGLSFCSMILPKIATTGGVARIVIELAVLFGAIAGCTAMPGGRNAWLRICASSVASAFDR